MDHQRLIAIGGSTGAIDVLKDLFRHLPADLPAPVLVTVHVGAHGRDLLAGILDGEGPVSVSTARDGDRPRPGCAYVAPADRHLLLMDGVLRLGRGPRENLARPAIDAMFRSVAADCGPGAVGLLVTGLQNDGAAGLAAIKECGGSTAVQDPANAAEAEMPLGALRASDVDFRAPVADLPSLLVHLASDATGPRLPIPAALGLEVEIALGRPSDAPTMASIGTPTSFSCPSCGGVLSCVSGRPLRFRCQIGHGFTADVLMREQAGLVDQALGAALRIVDERVTLIERMTEEARQMGRMHTQDGLKERAGELRTHSDTLRSALMSLRAGP